MRKEGNLPNFLHVSHMFHGKECSKVLHSISKYAHERISSALSNNLYSFSFRCHFYHVSMLGHVLKIHSHIYHVIYKDFWDDLLLCSHLRKLMLAEISFFKATQLGRNWIRIQPNFPALRPLIIHDCASIRLRHNLLYECPHGSGWESVKL